MPYLSNNKQEEAFYTLKKVLKKDSLLVLGDFDSCTKFKELLEHHTFCKKNFIEIAKNVYKRL
jgi:chemotaxis methyl-accepting protein methylase